MKRVALYYPWIYVRSGVERVILELVQRSRHRYTVFTNHVDYEQTYPEFRTLEHLVVLDDVPVERGFAAVLRAAGTIMRQKLDLQGFDALLVSSEGLGDLITFRNHGLPVLCFCHTPARPVYDPVYRRVWLERHKRARVPLALFSPLYAFLTRRAWRHYRRVFANSDEVRRRIADGKLYPPERVEVLHPGVDVERIQPSFAYDPYFLYAGRIKWTKNVELAVQAFLEFQRLVPDACDWRLIIAGSVDRHSQQYLADLQRLSANQPSIVYRLAASRAELYALYDRATAVLFPSLNEDWGIVPLEAMAFGKPVLAVNQGGPTESVADGATGLLLDPTPRAFAEKMAYLAGHPEEIHRMGINAVVRAERFSWAHFVKRLDEYIEQAC